MASVYRSSSPNLEALKLRLIYGPMEEFFVGGKAREGLKQVSNSDSSFDKNVVVIGYHNMKVVGYSVLDTCYIPHPEPTSSGKTGEMDCRMESI